MIYQPTNEYLNLHGYITYLFPFRVILIRETNNLAIMINHTKHPKTHHSTIPLNQLRRPAKLCSTFIKSSYRYFIMLFDKYSIWIDIIIFTFLLPSLVNFW